MSELFAIFIGDSVTVGTGDPEGLGWPGRLYRLERDRGHTLTVYNLGIRGQTIADIASRWQAEIKPRLAEVEPCALIFSAGLNDGTLIGGRPRIPLEHTEVHAALIMANARNFAPALFIGPTPIDEKRQPRLNRNGVVQAKKNAVIARTHDTLSSIAAQTGMPYLDLFTPLSRDPDWARDLADGVHPGAIGYQKIAERVANWPAWRRLLDGEATADIGAADARLAPRDDPPRQLPPPTRDDST